ASFVKGYMHNGYFKSLDEVVHFYNTRDVLPACPTDVSTEIGGDVGTKCWPAPEVPMNVNRTQTGEPGPFHGRRACDRCLPPDVDRRVFSVMRVD
ncbi:MAG: hypothetical protein WCB92_00990, partial [Mycobacterium sp.]